MSAPEPPRPHPRRKASLRARLGLALAASVGTLALLEGALWCIDPLPPVPPRLAHRFLPSYHAMSPGARVFEFDPGVLPGVTPGIRQVNVNSYGFLYPDERFARSGPAELRIAVVGGSTAECIVLPEEKRWSAVLEQLLREHLPERPVTVLNLGRSAIDTRTHMATMCQHITDLDVDVVVFMLGANDLSRAGVHDRPLLSPDNFYEPAKASRVVAQWLARTQIARHVIHWRSRCASSPRSTPYFQESVAKQAALPPLDPPLRMSDAGLAGYARAIVSLAGLCREHGIAAVFTTQPTMISRRLAPEEEAVLWGTNTGTHRVTPTNFLDLLEALNQCLLTTCAARGYACVDLAQLLPKGLTCFYDPVHFNEAGARRVAEALLPRVLASIANPR